MSKAGFMTELHEDRRRLLTAIDGLTAQEMTWAPAVGEGTVKD